MALAPQFSPFEILDLRVVSARSLAALFEEEMRQWRDQLHWDHRPSVEMIRKHIEAHNLPGYAALRERRAVGYCFFVFEDEKGLLGDLYVAEQHQDERPYGGRAGIATLLLQKALEKLEQAPGVRRIEAQLMPFGSESLAPVFLAHNFRCFPRLFMYKPLSRTPPSSRPSPTGIPGVHLRSWHDSDLKSMADLIVDAYEGHVDSQINDQYSKPAGSWRFLKNIVLFGGCGHFQPDSSFVAVFGSSAAGREPSGRMVGAVLTSQVAKGIGHITQLCVCRDWQGRGLGRCLLEVALGRLAAKGSTGVSLTVTSANQAAVPLYRRLGFTVIKEFAAFALDLR